MSPYLYDFYIFEHKSDMRSSKFDRETKLKILNERKELGISVEEICCKYKISQPTYYNWRRELLSDDNSALELKKENNLLRRLYIDLSEHNYQLAQFLNKQI